MKSTGKYWRCQTVGFVDLEVAVSYMFEGFYVLFLNPP